MRAGAARGFFAVFTLGALVMGCGPTVKSVCDDLDKQCPDLGYDTCLTNGDALQAAAEANKCDDALDAYLDCVDSALCTWRTSCEKERAALESCTGTFPR